MPKPLKTLTAYNKSRNSLSCKELSSTDIYDITKIQTVCIEIDTPAIIFHVLLTGFPQYGIILFYLTVEKNNSFIKTFFYGKKLGKPK